MLRTRRSFSVSSSVVALVAFAALAGVSACVNSVDRASENNAAIVQSHEEQAASLRTQDGGNLNAPVGADNFNLASDAGRR